MEWIKTSDRLPDSRDKMVLAVVNDYIIMGYFKAVEQYGLGPNGSKKDYKKTIWFDAACWLDKSSCDKCRSGERLCDENQCIDCCENDMSISHLIQSFTIDEVTHWMELPNAPKFTEK